MLVKVNDEYKGVFGLYVEKYHSVKAKRAGDPPFELADDVAHAQIKNGVLAAVDPKGVEVKTTDEIPTTPIETEPAEKNEPAEVEEMTYRELVAACRERGISYKGKKTEELKELVKEYDEADAPDLTAEDPI